MGDFYEISDLVVEAAFGYGPLDEPTWTNITPYVRQFSTSRGRSNEYSNYAPGTATIVLDNRERRFDPEHATGPYYGDLNPMVPVRVWIDNTLTDDSGDPLLTDDDEPLYTDSPVGGNIFYGFAKGWPQIIGKGYTDSTVTIQCVDAFRILAQSKMSGTAAPGETTGARIARILDDIDWPSGWRNLSTGDTWLAPAVLEGAALTELRRIEEIERGLLFIDPTNRVVFRDRNWQYLTTLTYTFADDYGTGLAFRDIIPDANTVDAIRNTSTVAWADGEVTASDATSIEDYGAADESVSSDLIPTEALAQGLADYIVRVGKTPRSRIARLVVLPRRDPNGIYPAVIGVDLGSRVDIDITPLGVGAATVYELAAQGIRHDVNRKGWTTTIYLAPAPATSGPYFVVGDATLGRIGAAAANRIPY